MSSKSVDPALIRELAEILADTSLTEIEVEKDDLKIRVAREVTVAAAPAHVQVAAPAAAPAAPAPVAASAADESDTPAQVDGEAVTAPMVGTVYLQPEPGAAQFVSVGDQVAEGQTLIIVEAMKTMNPIPAPRAGTVKAIMVDDGQPVEFGEPLVILD